MNSKKIPLLCIPFLVTTLVLTCVSAQSQIIPDGTMHNNSKVTLEGNTNIITGGTTAGSNLFHSFEQFSVPTGGVAYFNNALSIQNIISRVTGSSISNVDGILRANGTANLFLLNPNGIIFGPNASLSIGGSFLASTANNLKLADDTEFSATNPQPAPLLTINVPVGLGFTTVSPGSIQVKGYGHNELVVAAVGSPIFGAGQSLTGLRTQPGKTIALVGGQVNFDGGILTASSGRIEVGSVTSGLVNLTLADTGLFLNYDNIQSFQDTYLDNQALLDASGFLSGDIFLHGKNITLTQKSLAVVSNFGFLPSGRININATEKLSVAGVRTPSPPNNDVIGSARGIVSQNLSGGKGADITISANELVVQDFGGITTQTLGSGLGGNINLIVKESTRLFSSGLQTTGLTIGSIGTFTSGEGQGGNLELTTKKISLENGSIFTTQALKNGNGGNITVNATDRVEIIGGRKITFNQNFINNSFWSSSLGTFTTFSGKAGDLDINTNHLILKDGGILGSATVASGSAGKLTVNATDSVYVSGGASDILSPTQIISSATLTNPFFQQVFNLPGILLGESGYLTINTDRLTVQDGAQISVRNDGEKNAGTLTINANSINLDNQGGITAETRGIGNGGNLEINTDLLVALKNSDISANSRDFLGGKVTINAQGIFGTEFRNKPTSESDITATGKNSELNGVVQINTPDIDFTRATAQPVAEPESPEVTSVCQGRAGTTASELVNAGTGGIPISPSDPLNSNGGWYDNSPSTQALDSKETARVSDTETNKPEQIIEAQGWKWNADGTLSMTLEPEEVVPYSSLTTPLCNQVNRLESVAEYK